MEIGSEDLHGHFNFSFGPSAICGKVAYYCDNSRRFPTLSTALTQCLLVHFLDLSGAGFLVLLYLRLPYVCYLLSNPCMNLLQLN